MKLREDGRNNANAYLRVANFASKEEQTNQQLNSFKTNVSNVAISNVNLNEIRSLKDKTRLMRRQSSYNSMSEEPNLRFNESKELKLS